MCCKSRRVLCTGGGARVIVPFAFGSVRISPPNTYSRPIACSLALAADGSLFAWGGGEVGQVGTGDARDKLVPQCISPMVPIRGTDGEVAAHALRFAHCSAGSHHSMALVAVPGLNAVAFNPVAVMSASNVVSARKSKNLTLLVETAM